MHADELIAEGERGEHISSSLELRKVPLFNDDDDWETGAGAG